MGKIKLEKDLILQEYHFKINYMRFMSKYILTVYCVPGTILGSTGNTTGDESTQTHKEQILFPQIPSNKLSLHGIIEFVYNIHMNTDFQYFPLEISFHFLHKKGT